MNVHQKVMRWHWEKVNEKTISSIHPDLHPYSIHKDKRKMLKMKNVNGFLSVFKTETEDSTEIVKVVIGRCFAHRKSRCWRRVQIHRY